MIKKLTLVLISVVTAFSLVACGGYESDKVAQLTSSDTKETTTAKTETEESHVQTPSSAEIDLYGYLEKYYTGEVTIDKNNIEADVSKLSDEFYKLYINSNIKQSNYYLDYKFAPYKDAVRVYVRLYYDTDYGFYTLYSDVIPIKYSENTEKDSQK